jgi:hypothetical protein
MFTELVILNLIQKYKWNSTSSFWEKFPFREGVTSRERVFRNSELEGEVKSLNESIKSL